MFYLLTNQDNKTWRDVCWGENISNTETNSNYYFEVFKSPILASYLAPRQISQFKENESKIWLASGEGKSINWGLSSQFETLTTIKDINFVFPSTESRRTCAILAAMNLIADEDFQNWAIDYLSGKDKSIETAEKVYAAIKEKFNSVDSVEEQMHFASAHGIFAGLLKNNPDFFNACAIYKAHYDSIDRGIIFNVEEIAKIAYELPPEEIVGMLV